MLMRDQHLFKSPALDKNLCKWSLQIIITLNEDARFRNLIYSDLIETNIIARSLLQRCNGCGAEREREEKWSLC